jgi:glycosyltransferase involved in cell wall biosynthesis
VIVAVYGIAKDEAHNVAGWVESAAGADHVVLVDTGSSDDTMELARDAGALVHRVSVSPWRFDTARNTALALVPADVDVCVVLDMDERLEPGWREALEAAWYGWGAVHCTVQFAAGDDITLRYTMPRAHPRHGTVWKMPAHEHFATEGPVTVAEGMVITHRQSPKDRPGRDLPLLQLAARENPTDPRAAYYLARQYHYANDWVASRAEFERYLTLGGWDQERSEACLFMARMVWPDQMERWLLRACFEAPQRREPWAHLAKHYAGLGDQPGVDYAVSRARAIGLRADNQFHCEPWAWDDNQLEALLHVDA